MMTTKKTINGNDKERGRVLREVAARFNEALDDMAIPIGRGRAKALSHLINVSSRMAAFYVTGEKLPDFMEHSRIAIALNVRAEWLFYGLGYKREEADRRDARAAKVLQRIIQATDECAPLLAIDGDGEIRACLIRNLYHKLTDDK